MTPLDYERMAKKCAQEVDAMAPGPERDEMFKKQKQFESYAKMDGWIRETLPEVE